MASTGKLAERSARTREALLGAARIRFGRDGYAETNIETVVREARVTRGALYHHFPDGKPALFEALFEQMEAELSQRSVAAAKRGVDALDMLRRGMAAFLDACLEPEVRRIVLIDGLSVLGWERWHEIGARHNLGIMRAGVSAAMEGGHIRKMPVEPLANLLQGGLIQVGMALAHEVSPQKAKRAAIRQVEALLDGLRI